MQLLSYHIEVAICLSIFYIVYVLFFKRETFFKINRYVIISSLVVAFIIPLIELPSADVAGSAVIRPLEIEKRLFEITIYADRDASFDYFPKLQYIYLFGVAIGLSLFALNVFKILRLRRKAKHTDIDGSPILLLDDHINPFTFFKNIFISRSALENKNISELLRHEKVHSRQWHSLDIVLFEFLKIFHWFNPVIYLFGREIREVHEYIADSEVLAKGGDKADYIDIMLSYAMGTPISGLANNFSGIKLIKRLKMITKPKSHRSLAIKYVMIIPAVLVLMLAFSCKDEQYTSSTHSGNYYADIYPQVYDNEERATSFSKNQKARKAQFVHEYASPEFNNEFEFTNIVVSSNTHKKLLEQGKALKVAFSFKVLENGNIEDPIITNYSYAHEKRWSHSKLPSDIEDDLIQAMSKANIKYSPAIKDGKPIDSYSGSILLFGDENAWYKVYPRDDFSSLSNKKKKESTIPVVKPKDTTSFYEGALLSQEHYSHIARVMNYPEDARKNNIEGIVIVDFSVNNNGEVVNPKVMKSLGYGCDEEALRVVGSLKGIDTHKPNVTKAIHRLPIRFKLR